MRVIAGEFRGRTLTAVDDRSVRPATGRVKGTIFNMLQSRLNLNGADVLDLFAGSGSLGFEALSRGAGRVVFVENGRKALDAIANNAAALACEDRCDFVQMDALDYIERCEASFDLVFADPPYAYEATTDIPPELFGRHLVKKDGIVIIEHTRHTLFGEGDSFRTSAQKKFGNTLVSFFSWRPKEATK